MHGCLRREQSGSSCEPAWWGCPEHAGQGGGPHALARQRKSAPKALRFIQGISKNKKPFKGGGGLLKGHVIGAIYIYIFFSIGCLKFASSHLLFQGVSFFICLET